MGEGGGGCVGGGVGGGRMRTGLKGDLGGRGRGIFVVFGMGWVGVGGVKWQGK